ncbi:MAG TPA: hypothetical protein VGD74_03475 [Vulgatibacter sp.]
MSKTHGSERRNPIWLLTLIIATSGGALACGSADGRTSKPSDSSSADSIQADLTATGGRSASSRFTLISITGPAPSAVGPATERFRDGEGIGGER